ncbi:hypothetical protein LPJ66_007377 [Kickxella alabastrina]|uniref:Uncharacterized protein n=2 Tax=Kickxella alabastrina TaxID=61397 RepID=A0ACC1I9L2_9FUNG|nr:hypothetical protein LPJ66_007415 [Kickxella alabastrina]KAJ1890607.1 hypothetical protein LPJ66_007377 [Kickxella alabastrina]
MFRNTLARASTIKHLAQMQQSRNLACSVMYVKNLPLEFDEASLTPFIEEFGPVYQTNFMNRRPEDRFSIAFVKFYSGELPSTVEELAELPAPTPEEVADVNKRCSAAISALNGATIGSNTVNAAFGIKNLPDAIQFNARMMVRKANDPIFAARMDTKVRAMQNTRNGSEDGRNPQYLSGYKNGFKEGFEAGKQESSE